MTHDDPRSSSRFVHRYRDTCDDPHDMRLNLGRAVYELLLLGDHQLKYLGWMLNDTSPLVQRRLVAALDLPRPPHVTAKLANFTVFEKRIYEMIARCRRPCVTSHDLLWPPMASYDLPSPYSSPP